MGISEQDSHQTPAPQRTRRAHPLRSLWIGILLGVVVVLMVTAMVLLLRSGGTLPILTETRYNEAYERWQSHGPASYDLEVAVGGDQPGTIKVQVRDGRVTDMTRNGVRPRRKSTWDYWSVPGQFDVIGVDLETAAKAGQPQSSRLVLRARFDPKLGYPAQYQRIDLDTRHEGAWEVTRFVAR